nr:hypothetical protein [Tanacetum cinerariifolium]
MCNKIKRLMQGTNISRLERNSRLMNEFYKYVVEDGESLTSVYERVSTLINIMDRNKVSPKEIFINIKFLNSLQPEWSKYVTLAHQKEQMLLATKYEAEVHLDKEENAFMLDNAYEDNTLEELNATVIMMARIRPTNDKSDVKPIYDAKLINEKDKNACDVSWKSKMAKLNGENMPLNIQIKSLITKRENIKLEYQKLFNSIKMTRVQHQYEVNELITYAYGDVRAKNQDHLMTNSELKEKLKIAEKGKNVNTKFDKSTTLGKILCVTPMNKNKDLKAKMVSKVKVKMDKPKPITSCSTPKNEQGLASSSSVRRLESKESNSKKKVFMNTKFKSTFKDVKKSQSSVSLVSNKRDTLNSNVYESNANVLKEKTINVVNDGSNLLCVSCGKDVFMISHDKFVTRYDLSPNSRVKRALFTSLVAAKSSQVGAALVVVKSRFSVATPPKATNKVPHASSLTPESRKSRKLRTYMKNKIKTSRKWQKWFENQSSFNWSPKSPTAQIPPSVTTSSTSAKPHSRTLVTKQQWVAKLSTLPSGFVSCDVSDPARPLDF